MWTVRCPSLREQCGGPRGRRGLENMAVDQRKYLERRQLRNLREF